MSNAATPISILISGAVIAAAVYLAPAREAYPPVASPKTEKAKVGDESEAKSVNVDKSWQLPGPFIIERNDSSESRRATSEDLRKLIDEWEQIWFLDSPPSERAPFRTHGGII